VKGVFTHRYYYNYKEIIRIQIKTRDANAAARFFQTALQATHTATPRVITVDKHAASPPALQYRLSTHTQRQPM
jgi:transposase-like protein